jgi:hypothetical protein
MVQSPNILKKISLVKNNVWTKNYIFGIRYSSFVKYKNMDYKVNETSLVIYSYENCSSLKISPIITPWHVDGIKYDFRKLLNPKIKSL